MRRHALLRFGHGDVEQVLRDAGAAVPAGARSVLQVRGNLQRLWLKNYAVALSAYHFKVRRSAAQINW